MKIPQQLISNILNIYHNTGQKWLDELPQLISHYEKKWHFKLIQPFNNACFNYVASVKLNDGTEAVFKCGIPGL